MSRQIGTFAPTCADASGEAVTDPHYGIGKAPGTDYSGVA